MKYKLLIALLLIPLILLVISPNAVTSTPDDWADENWLYRKELTLTAHPENYQIYLVLSKADNLNGHCLDNFDDVRFYENDNGGLLNFWRENINIGDNAVFWIRRLENEISDTSIWIYYGNTNAQNIENGNNTFALFDDFSGTALNSLWAVRGGTPIVENGILELNRGSVATETIYSNWVFGMGYSAKIKAKTYGASVYQGMGFTTNSDIGDAAGVYIIDGFAKFRTRNITVTDTAGLQTFLNSWLIYESARIKSNLARGYIRENLVATHTTNIPTANLSVEIQSYSTSQLLVDWVFVRKVENIEPKGTLGLEQSTITLIINLVYPDNNASFNLNDDITFLWSTTINAENYRLEISEYENFTTTVDNVTTTDNYYTITLDISYHPDNYYWRLWAENLNAAFNENVSETRRFYIIEVIIENNVSIIVTSGTFAVNETAVIYAQVLKTNGSSINDNDISIVIFNSSNSVIENDDMVYIQNSNGLYSFTTSFTNEGNYICDVSLDSSTSGFGSNNIRIISDSSSVYDNLIQTVFIIFIMIVGLYLLSIKTSPLLPLFIGFGIAVIASFIALPLFPFINIIMALIGIGDILTAIIDIKRR